MGVPSLAVQVQGQGVVSADNLNTYFQTCDNVADLQGFIGISGLQVYMRGFTNPGDGGQGSFYWNATGTGPDDNGVTNIVPNGSALGCWTRIPQILSSTQIIIQAVATGINTIALAPVIGSPTVSYYLNNEIYGFYATNTTTGVVTLNYNGLGPKSAYDGDGSTQLSTGSLVQNEYYLFVYNASLNSNAGGFQLLNNVTTYTKLISAPTGTFTGLVTAGLVNLTSAIIPTNGFYLPASNTVGVSANSNLVAEFSNTGVANQLMFSNAATTTSPSITAIGSDTNIGMAFFTKGTGSFEFFTNNSSSTPEFFVAATPSSVNWVQVSGSPSANPSTVTVSAQGSDTNTSISLIAKGTGNILAPSVNSNTSGSAANVFVDSSGTLLKSVSSLKYKRDVVTYDKGLDVIRKMRPVYYKSKAENDGETQFAGLIAEEVEALGLKEFVVYQNSKPDALAYSHMVALLISGIKEQDEIIKTLSDRLDALEKK